MGTEEEIHCHIRGDVDNTLLDWDHPQGQKMDRRTDSRHYHFVKCSFCVPTIVMVTQ
jgi:hypothetical protein